MKNVFGLLNISSKFRVICVINGLEKRPGECCLCPYQWSILKLVKEIIVKAFRMS